MPKHLHIVPQPPRHAPLGHLTASDGTRVSVSINYNRDELLLVILDGAEPFFERSLALLSLESSGHGRRLVHSHGSGRRLDSNIVRFTAEDPASDLLQRREFIRVPAMQRVILRGPDEKVLAITLTVDISGGGMLIRLPSTLTIDQAVGFELSLDRPEEVKIVGTARVARAEFEDQRALAFWAIEQTDRERLIKFIFDCQRRALAATRHGAAGRGGTA